MEYRIDDADGAMVAVPALAMEFNSDDAVESTLPL